MIPHVQKDVQARVLSASSSACRLQGALPAAGIVEPTPVQLEAIPPILRGVDVAVQSYTGSGKVKLLHTGAAGLSIIVTLAACAL